MFSLKGLIFSFKASVNAYIFIYFLHFTTFAYLLVSISKAIKNVCMVYILGNFPQWDYWMQMLWDGCMWKKNFPHAYKDSTISEAIGQKNFSLKKDEWCKIYLDKSHAYYYQIQAQIFIFAVEHCDFVMWSTKDLLCIKFFLTESFEKMQSVLPLSSSASAFCLKL